MGSIQPLHPPDGEWTERPIASSPSADGRPAGFLRWFGDSPDAWFLLAPDGGCILVANPAAAALLGVADPARITGRRPADLGPELQPDGSDSAERMARGLATAARDGRHRFEWTARGEDGSPVPLDVAVHGIDLDGSRLLAMCWRDVSGSKRVSEEMRRLNATLEQRVAARTSELTASEARLRTLVENAPEAIVVFDGETGRFELVNDHAVRLYGRAREELLQLRPGEVSPPFQPDGRPSTLAAEERIREALNGGMPVFEWLHQHSSGREFISEVRLVRLPSEGRPLVRASIIDTTVRRRREQTQRAVYQISEAVHAAADLPALYARIHSIVRGLMPAENFFIALYEPSTELISFPYYVDELATSIPQPRRLTTGLTGLVLRTGRAVLADRQFTERTRKEGDRIVVEALGSVSYIESGRPAAVWLGVPLTIQGTAIGVMAVQDYRDEDAYGEEEKQILGFVATQTAVAIERKRSEESLRDLVEKHRALFEASSQGVMLHDDQQFLEVNPAAVRILGRRHASEILGHHPAEFAPVLQPNGESSDTLARRAIAECLDQGSVHFEWSVLRQDGQLIDMDVLLTRIQWRGRWIIQAMVEDITDRKRAEAELLKALAREKELNQLKTSFVSMVSHEFRTPLGIILSSSEILGDYFERLSPADRAEHLRSIARNTRQMANLMEEVLVLSRVESGGPPAEPPPVDLAALAARLANEVRTTTDHQREIQLSVADDCRGARADETLLRHIFINLLSNAVKYSPAGSPVDFHLRREGDDVVARVVDRGIGIPESDREWLFAAFHRGRNVGDRPGSGLGLTIVKRCVELHGGRIGLLSELGRGTEITVRLPLFREPQARPLTEP